MNETIVVEKYKYYFPLIILPVYFVVSVIGVYHHELWLDEAHSFLLARDNNSLPAMIQACRYEGHPLLWNILLFIVTRFTHNVLGMQLLHVVINCFTVYFICKSPFSIVEKILIIFSYYCLFEYNIISRNYGMGLLFIVMVAYVYSKNNKALLTLSVLLFLLANTHLFALLFSVAFAIMYLVFNRAVLAGTKRKLLILSGCILLAGWVIAALAIMPPSGYTSTFIGHETSGYLSPARLLKTISVCLKGIFYLPDYFKYHFMNTVLYNRIPGYIVLVLSLLAFAVPIVLLNKYKQAVCLFILFSFLYVAVYYFMPLTYGIRYFGFFYMAFIACYWLAYKNVSNTKKKVVAVILFVQFVNGLYACTMDIRYPFSESKNVGRFLNEHIQKENVYIIGNTPRPGISAYTGKKYFGTENGQMLSYCLWNKQLPDDSLKHLLNIHLNQDTTPSIIIANQPLGAFLDTSKLVKINAFDKGIESGDNVTIYRYLPGK